MPEAIHRMTPMQRLALAFSAVLPGPQAGNCMQQTERETMSRAMHAAHGELVRNGQRLFPEIPASNDPRRGKTPGRAPSKAFIENLLQQTL